MTKARACGRVRGLGWYGARGFTLIELLIVVAIIGILAAIAYPGYQEQIRKSRRADAQAVLFELAQLMERRYTENGTYLESDDSVPNLGAGGIFPDKSPIDGGELYYRLEIDDDGADSTTADTYLLRATPQGSQASDACGKLTLDNLGGKDVEGASLPADRCW
jgi:type IV pilus assembly protein PilE